VYIWLGMTATAVYFWCLHQIACLKFIMYSSS
jgi:hypothetical protein